VTGNFALEGAEQRGKPSLAENRVVPPMYCFNSWKHEYALNNPIHRYAWISNYGEDMPPGRSALVAEVTVPPKQKVDLEELKQEVVQGLAELGELREEDVGVAAAWFHGYGYPVYTLTHSGDVAALERCLRELGVVPFGRWGSWQYWNTDRIFEEAQKLTL